jgi:5-methylcytosine-specific restriction endonuclease McrA
MDILEHIQAFSALLRRKEAFRAELYGERDRNLSKLAYRDYREYLHSQRHWRGRSGIRQKVLRRDKSICVCCGVKSNKIVHHRRYTMEVLTGDDLSALVTVCQPCHQVIEFDAQRERRSRTDKEWVLDFMRKEMGPTTPLRWLD